MENALTVLTWFIGTLGVSCLFGLIGFLVGSAWGINVAQAGARPENMTALLSPQFWTEERMKRAAEASNPAPRKGFDSPGTYIPGLDDGT